MTKTTPPPIPQPKKGEMAKVKTRAQNDIENEIRKFKLNLASLTMKSPLYGEVYRKCYELEKLYKQMYNEKPPEITPWTRSP